MEYYIANKVDLLVLKRLNWVQSIWTQFKSIGTNLSKNVLGLFFKSHRGFLAVLTVILFWVMLGYTSVWVLKHKDNKVEQFAEDKIEGFLGFERDELDGLIDITPSNDG